MHARSCGTCSLCCKLPYVAELNKPINTWAHTPGPATAVARYMRIGRICGSAAYLSDFLLRLPGSINAVAMPCATIQDNRALDTTSGPLSLPGMSARRVGRARKINSLHHLSLKMETSG
jgi:hypothetical protein